MNNFENEKRTLPVVNVIFECILKINQQQQNIEEENFKTKIQKSLTSINGVKMT